MAPSGWFEDSTFFRTGSKPPSRNEFVDEICYVSVDTWWKTNRLGGPPYFCCHMLDKFPGFHNNLWVYIYIYGYMTILNLKHTGMSIPVVSPVFLQKSRQPYIYITKQINIISIISHNFDQKHPSISKSSFCSTHICHLNMDVYPSNNSQTFFPDQRPRGSSLSTAHHARGGADVHIFVVVGLGRCDFLFWGAIW